MPPRLRPRGPRRTDPQLMAIHDALNLDVLRYIALLAQTHRSPYRTRGRVRAARELRARIVATRAPSGAEA